MTGSLLLHLLQPLSQHSPVLIEVVSNVPLEWEEGGSKGITPLSPTFMPSLHPPFPLPPSLPPVPLPPPSHQQSDGGERDVDVHGLQAELAGHLHAHGQAGGRESHEEVSNDQLQALETGPHQRLAGKGAGREERVGGRGGI